MRPAGFRTPTKTRVLAGGIHSAKQQIVRIDREPTDPPPAPVLQAFAEKVLATIDRADAVLLSDYGYGVVTPLLAEAVVHRLRSSGSQAPVLVDSRYNLGAFRDVTACTPNQPEVEQLLGVRINDDLDVLERAGRTLLRRLRMQAVLVTRGSHGMSLFEPKVPTVHIPIHGTDEIADVTGAGDTVMATMALALAAGATFHEAARLANYAGGIVVMKRGTATVSAEELRQAIQADGYRIGRSRRPPGRTEPSMGQIVTEDQLDALACRRPRGRPHHRVRQRLLRPAARRPRALPGRRRGAKPTA